MNWNLRNIAERTIWTFVQAFAGTWIALSATLTLSDWQQVKAAVLAGITAGLLAIAKNLTAEGIVVQATTRMPTIAVPPATKRTRP